MPPTLGRSQVSTAKKQIKLQLFSICKTPHAIEFQPQITNALTELGCTSNEVN
jgi:symplekin